MASITKEKLIEVLAQVESAGPLASRQAVWRAVAGRLLADGISLTVNAISSKARRWGVEPRTPPADCPARRRRRDEGGIEPESVETAPGTPGDSPGSDEGVTKVDLSQNKKRFSLPMVRAATPRRWHHLVDKAEKGSIKATIRLACGECVGWELKEARECELVACPLHAVNPWRRSREPTTKKGNVESPTIV